MAIPILQMSLPIPTPSTYNLSSSSRIGSNPSQLFLTSKFSHLSIAKTPKTTIIRMGGGPRTFPGGVSKWQWKRMQAKKAKQLLRARLARERQVYEMRKRAELSAAVSELERPWEVVEKAPKLFSASADEQLKVLADRFQKPGGFDLWSEKDGPELFEAVDGLPSARFFPKGVVHSIKPYGKITDGDSGHESGLDTDPGIVRRNGYDENSRNGNRRIRPCLDEDSGLNSGLDSGLGQRNGYDEDSRNARGNSRNTGSGYPFSDEDSGLGRRNGHENPRNANGKLKKNGDRRIGYQISDENSGLDGRNGHENSRNANGKLRKNGDRRIGYHISDENSGLDWRNGHENSRNVNGKSKEKGDKRIGYQISDENLGLGWRNGQENPRNVNGKLRKNGNRRIGTTNMESMRNERRETARGNGRKSYSVSNSKVFDMNLRDDGSYGILSKERRVERK